MKLVICFAYLAVLKDFVFMYMASSRKIWKTKKVTQLIFGIIIIVLLCIIIYRKKDLGKFGEENNLNFFITKSKSDSLSQSRQDDIRATDKTSFSAAVAHVKMIGFQENLLQDEIAEVAFQGHRIVHLDLKGAPPKVTYFADFFPFIKKAGATGILLEYEDMFPYLSVDVMASNAYSKEEIEQILKYAEDNSLEVIPLIQTFGHLEFLLKLEKYAHLREIKQYPQAICPSKNESVNILYSMIDDILEAHRNIKYFHIGCDEVYQLGECSDCREVLHRRRLTKKQLFLDHVSKLARYIIKKSRGKVKPLVWDDELRTLTINELKEWSMGELVEPVVWKYTADVEVQLTPDLWTRYAAVFDNVWFASAFKGARAPDAFINYINFYYENHKSWLKLITRLEGKTKFRGGILTGWQRYDHFAVLCELLPVSIPSLVLNLIYLSTGISSMVDLSLKTQKMCSCGTNPLSVTVLHGHCSFPGSRLFVAVTKLPSIIFGLQRIKDESPYKGWMTQYNIEHSFSNPSHVEEATNDMLSLFSEIQEVEQELVYALTEVFDNATLSEWMYTYVRPIKEEIRTVVEARDKILSMSSWPKRPLFN